MDRLERESILEEIARLRRALDALDAESSDLPTEVSEEPEPTLPRIALPETPDAALTVPALKRRAKPVVVPRTPSEPQSFEQRYAAGSTLGEGGMGEVRLTMDRSIGRAVAMKIIRPENARQPRLRARFLFEAKVQGQLEHPSIVPVYDLGARPDGVEFFTMKRVHGRTLHDVLKALAAGDEATKKAYSRRKLLGALQAACLAVEFAHQRGVVHRDLKPANLMIGALGELSVLDWGLAKIVRTERRITPPPEAEAALEAARSSEETAIGEVLGTPGYMSPEQAAGATDVDARSDVFSLGAMLFEILTLKHLVPGKVSKDINRATLLGEYDARIGERYPELDVPPELEAACVRATAHDKGQRTATALELHRAIERYLEGDRDVERRRSLAGVHTRAAIAAMAEMADAKAPEAAGAARKRAVREVTRALAIDPDNRTALGAMMRLVTDGGAPASPETEAKVAGIERKSRQKVARRGATGYLICAGFLCIVALLGVKSWLALGGCLGFFLAAAGLALVTSSRVAFTDSRLASVAIIALSSCAVAVAAGLFGPFMYAPSLCAANVIAFAAGVDARSRAFGIVFGIAAALAPLGLEELGIGPPSWAVLGDHIELFSRAVAFPPLATKLVLSLEMIGTIVVPAIIVGAERDARRRAERRLALQAQQLAEFAPAEVRPVS